MSSHCVRWGIRSDGPDTILKANFGQKRCDFGQKGAILGKKSDKSGIGPFFTISFPQTIYIFLAILGHAAGN